MKLTDKEKEILLNHDYDGIQEFDYPLPNWWLATFYGAILFSSAYFIYFQLLGGPTLREEYKADYLQVKTKQVRYYESISEFDREKFKLFINSSELVAYGKEVYEINCIGCHAANGSGDIGPNLTDNFWLYTVGDPSSFFEFILEGNPDGGMPSWVDKLEEDDLYAVVSYIMTNQGKTFQNSKEPQGEEYPLWNKNDLSINL